MFICGSKSFSHQDKDDSYRSPCSTPKRSSKRSKTSSKFLGKDKCKKNPYADRGLDKFSALLDDLDDKKQKIYAQMGADDISFVQFVYSGNSQNVKPIVVKVKNKNKNNVSSAVLLANASDESLDSIIEKDREIVTSQEQKKEYMKKRSTRWNGSFRLDDLKNGPSSVYCFTAILALILLFLAIYNGRSFAILCTSMSWYLVPTVVGGKYSSSLIGRKPVIKRKVSDKSIVQTEGPSSPTSLSVMNWPIDI